MKDSITLPNTAMLNENVNKQLASSKFKIENILKKIKFKKYFNLKNIEIWLYMRNVDCRILFERYQKTIDAVLHCHFMPDWMSDWTSFCFVTLKLWYMK